MKRTASRLVYTVIVLFVSSIAVFYAIRLSGGDATAAALPGSATATAELCRRCRAVDAA